MAWSPVSSVADIPAPQTDTPLPAVNKHHISFLLSPSTDVLLPPTPLQLSTTQQQPQPQHQQQHPLNTPLNLSPMRLPSPPIHVPYASSPLSSSPSTFSCRECSFISNTSEELTLHIRLAHKAKPFACKVCHKTFAERGNANKHFRVAHLKQRNHKCQTCDRSFAFRDGLNRHISMVHLNQRPFECTECMCPRGPHPRAIPCTHICGMRFKQKSHRRRHVLSVHHAGGKRVTPDARPFVRPEQLQLALQPPAEQVS